MNGVIGKTTQLATDRLHITTIVKLNLYKFKRMVLRLYDGILYIIVYCSWRWTALFIVAIFTRAACTWVSNFSRFSTFSMSSNFSPPGLESATNGVNGSTNGTFSLEHILGDNHDAIATTSEKAATGWDEEETEKPVLEGYCVECEGLFHIKKAQISI